MADPKFTREYVCSILDYCPDTGEFRWKVKRKRVNPGEVAGAPCRGYVVVKIDQRRVPAHRLAWLCFYGQWPQHTIDHINGQRNDNRISNLRDVPHQVNMQNMGHRARARRHPWMTGTRKHADRWIAYICVNGRGKHIGCFASEEQARQAYLSAKRLLHPGCTI